MRAIAALSRGIPRPINVVCGRATPMATVVDAETVDRSARDLPRLGDGTPRVPAKASASRSSTPRDRGAPGAQRAGFSDVLRHPTQVPAVVDTEASAMATIELEPEPAPLSPPAAPTPRPIRKEPPREARRPEIAPPPRHEAAGIPESSRAASAVTHPRPGDAADAPDPRAIIDWLLGTYTPATDTGR